ncbi:unnamed protein product (macronuclear) [Paramecium tetraurelia]|uniref:Protein kinase domain-containing protein n=1 Tax=Paramecium tetraurelia TaxID=5888 RepID=A0DF43_PARTE|nr:uncharacterized protein GSPATT00016473001 [Paramecium tetraurelia]CAK81660.1 unnamed protein product [Paramecium tetraurelia]|eukprot:XP_001449057.1 hypothetical protein (macronuclear) [Paramecium tetraurelia strain d4-2]
MSNFNLKYKLLETNAGILYQAEEENERQKINYYAYDLSPDFQERCFKEEAKIENCKSIRQHVKQILYQNKPRILFQYQDGLTLDRIIQEYRAKKESIAFTEIRLYLIQILDTLYHLHSHYILGRVFSTKNILDCQGQILFLDFGFGPKIMEQNVDLIAPPEIIESVFLEREQSHNQYNMKVDSWLLGAVLYHLVKLSPINTIEIEKGKVKCMQFKDTPAYSAYLNNRINQNIKHIEALTDRYDKEFCYFIQGLLTYDPNSRLSFLQIYKHSFIQNLKIPNYQTYLQFYENYNEQQLIKQIMLYEDHGSKILKTGLLLNGQNLQQQIVQPEDNIPHLILDSNRYIQNNEDIEFPLTSQRLSESIQSEVKDNSIEYLFVHQIQGLNESSFYQIWLRIRMELFRFTFLELVAQELQEELPKKEFKLEHVCAYSLRKMGYLILIDLQKKINEDVFPWKSHQQDNQKWKDFQKETQKSILENNIKRKIIEMEPTLKEEFLTHCKIYLDDQRIDKVIREELQADERCFQTQKIESQPIYKTYSNDFLKKGYRQIMQMAYNFLQREQKLAKKPELKYNTLLLKIIICHLINRIFNLDRLSVSFKRILQSRNRPPLSLISPNEIYEYICRDGENEKIQDIQYLLQVESE